MHSPSGQYEHVYALIMAGGEGTRFAPLSTPDCPKQFLQMVGEGTFLQQTRRRVAPIVPAERTYVATNRRYLDLVQTQLADVPKANIIGESQKRNTAPCIAYASRLIHHRDPDALIVVLPSDHVILKPDAFLETLHAALDVAARERRLVTLGISPRWPSTGYGYIRARQARCERRGVARDVQEFVEKPNLETAQRYLADGGYYWNSGIFVWTSRSILSEIDRSLPEMHHLLEGFDESDSFQDRFFRDVQSISIDYGVLEKSNIVSVVPCDPDWSDVGTWESLYDLYKSGKATVAPLAVQTMRRMMGYADPAEVDTGIPRRVEKPWGYEEIWAHTSDYVGKILFVRGEHRLSFQYHRVKEETIRILEGIVDLEYSDGDALRTVRMKEGDVFHLPPMTKHRFVAVETCRILEVSTPYLRDVVRLADDYGRKDTEL